MLLKIGLFLFFFLLPLPTFAGGPLEIRKGMALSYGNKPLVYRYDAGMLGNLENQDAVDLVEGLFSIWEDVPTASVKFKQDKPGFIGQDVDKNNFKKFLLPRSESDLNRFTPVVFDEDGSLLDGLLGSSGGNAAIGIGGPVVFSKGGSHKIVESQIVLNGRFINGVDTPDDREVDLDTYKRTILHEIGHAISLDHSQVNVEAIDAGATQEVKNTTPVMFPRAVSSLFALGQDDISAVSLLYPAKTQLDTVGQIKGQIFRKGGVEPVLGANVIARNIDDPEIKAVSCVSDFLKRKNGEYVLFALPPGNYTLEIEPISKSFVSTEAMGSVGPKVGPYTKNLDDKSFLDPVPQGFYTGSNLPITQNVANAKILSVNAGDNLSGIDVISVLQFVPAEADVDISLKRPFVLKNNSRAVLVVSALDFSEPSKCKVIFPDDLRIKVKPSSFVLQSEKSIKNISMKFPKQAVESIVGNGLSEINLLINCANGASKDFLLSF